MKRKTSIKKVIGIVIGVPLGIFILFMIYVAATTKPTSDEPTPTSSLSSSETTEQSKEDFNKQLKARAIEASFSSAVKGEYAQSAILTITGTVSGIQDGSKSWEVPVPKQFLLKTDDGAYIVGYFPDEVPLNEGDTIRVYGAYKGSMQVNNDYSTQAPTILGSLIEKVE